MSKPFHTEMNSSESHQAHADSDGARSATLEEEHRRRTSRRHVCPKLKLITRSGEREKYRDKDEANKAKIERTPGESKVMLQDRMRKCKEVNCVGKEDLEWNTELIEMKKLENLICQAVAVH